MKTITIELDNNLERQINSLSEQEGRDIHSVILDAIIQGLSEKQRRLIARKALDDVFSRPIPEPFNEMAEDEIMRTVEQEIRIEREPDLSSFSP